MIVGDNDTHLFFTSIWKYSLIEYYLKSIVLTSYNMFLYNSEIMSTICKITINYKIFSLKHKICIENNSPEDTWIIYVAS